jgi:asparagine synthase (glutamine-hydrolysing)
MESPDTGDVIVYNGEIYNVAELRSELTVTGATFRSTGDTEVLLAAFARWGIGCVERLYGMFAFALWSPRSQSLYLARDALGIKPLYWWSRAGVLVVASELRGVLASGLVDRVVDRVAVQSLLAYGAVAQPRTMVEGVRQLDPGTWAKIHVADTSGVHHSRYWAFNTNPRVELTSTSAVKELSTALAASVKSHLVSDVPLAVFLSGGIDSTCMAALGRDAREIDTFSVGLREDAAIDESGVAKRTAERLNTRHHEVVLGERDALGLVMDWLRCMDQPTVDGLNTFVISRAARETGIVVAISGLGGDEMFGGYSTFREAPLLARVGRVMSRAPSSVTRTGTRWFLASTTRAEKLGDLLVATRPSVVSATLGQRRLMSNAQMTALGLGEGAREDFLPPESDPLQGVPAGSDWAAVRAVETRFYMGNMLLRDADVASMANGLEIRVPLLDRRVVEVALSHARWAADPRTRPNKPWLVGALGRRIPVEVLQRRKSGFSLPQARWMAGPLRALFEARIQTLAKSGLLDPRGVLGVWEGFVREGGHAWSRAWLLGVLGEWVGQRDPRNDACMTPTGTVARP